MIRKRLGGKTNEKIVHSKVSQTHASDSPLETNWVGLKPNPRQATL